MKEFEWRATVQHLAGAVVQPVLDLTHLLRSGHLDDLKAFLLSDSAVYLQRSSALCFTLTLKKCLPDTGIEAQIWHMSVQHT